MSKGKLVGFVAVFILLLVAPFALVSLGPWPGIIGVAFYGIMVASLAWVYGGSRSALKVLLAFEVLMVIAILIAGNALLSAILVLLLGIAYGIAARYGWSQTILQIPILVPYFLMAPPVLYSQNPPTINAAYVVGCLVFVLIGGLWALLLLNKFRPNHQPLPQAHVSKDRAIVYGLLLGVFSAIGVYVAITWVPQSNWAWLTLTLYVLSNPAKDFDWIKMRDRLVGTVAGFVVVSVVFLLTDSQPVTYLVGTITAWLALSAMATGLPYWAYVIVLTPTVVLFTATASNREIFADQRLDFTILGIVLTVIVASVASLILRSAEKSPPAVAAAK